VTLRRRVVLALLGLSVLFLAIGSLATVAIRQYLVSRIDQTLLVGGFDNGSVPPVVLLGRRDPCQFPQVADAIIVFGNEQGDMVEGCGRASTLSIDFASLTFGDDGATDPVTVSDDNGTDYRLRARRLHTGIYVGFGLSLTGTNRAIRRVAFIQLAAGLCVLLGVAVVARWLLRRGLAPLDRIASTADLIAASDRSQRVDLGGHSNDEVGRVGRALNGMLDELDRSFIEVSASRDERERAEQRLRQFVQDASHELRTPLTSIRGYCELFHQGALPAGFSVGDAMSRIGSEADRMSRLVNDMLRLAKLDAEPQLTMSQVDVVALTERAAADAYATDPRWPVSVNRNMGSGQSASAVVDPEAIHQVLSNLLANVRAHTPPGTATTITIGVEQNDSRLELTVTDNGPGIDPEVLPEIFQRFVRADRSRQRASGGSGLGLSIVKSIIDAHSGVISARNVQGGGAEFAISLPLSNR
jgi:two-component system, OmpR family, sensor kinase